jgi:hypothetical protein
VSGAGVDPSERAEVLLLRAEELLASATPESLDEAVLALEGARDAAGETGVEPALRERIDERLASARARRDGEEEDEPDSE